MTCLSCEYQKYWEETGEFPSEEAARHWSLWGCTCDPKSQEEAVDKMKEVVK